MNHIKRKEHFISEVAKSVSKVMLQGTASMFNAGGCAYRGQEPGTCCIVGHMIKDEFYDTFLENSSSDNTEVEMAITLSLGYVELMPTERDLLRKLQEVHDYYLSPNGEEFQLNESYEESCIRMFPSLLKEVYKFAGQDKQYSDELTRRAINPSTPRVSGAGF